MVVAAAAFFWSFFLGGDVYEGFFCGSALSGGVFVVVSVRWRFEGGLWCLGCSVSLLFCGCVLAVLFVVAVLWW